MAKRRPDQRNDPRRDALERGRRLLAAWGFHDDAFPPGAPPAEILALVDPLIGRDPACDVVLAQHLGGIPDAAVAARLAAWEASAADKELRREIRRALFRLEQKGIAAPRREEERPAFSLRGGVAAEPSAWLGAVDGEGSRMAWLLKRDGGGYSGIFSVLNDRTGMTYVAAGSLPRQGLESQLKELDASAPGAPVRVPWAYADAQMHAAFRRGAPRPGKMRADYLLHRAEIVPGPPAWSAAPPLDDLATGADDDAGVLESSAELFRRREFAGWSLPEAIAREHVQMLHNTTHSGLVLSREAATERMVGILDRAQSALVASEWRGILARRLDENAYVLLLKGETEAARSARAVARALDDGDPARLGKVSFVRALVFRGFAPHLAQAAPEPGPDAAAETAEGSSVILDPAKVRETGVAGAGGVADPADPPGSRLILP